VLSKNTIKQTTAKNTAHRGHFSAYLKGLMQIMKIIITTILVYFMLISTAFANPTSFEYLTKTTEDNPLISRCAFKIRDQDKIRAAIRGEDGYVFIINNMNEDLFKDESFFYMIIYRRLNTQCNGDIIYECNAKNKIVRVLEACSIHGITELDHKVIPYLNRTINVAYQLADKVPISVAK